MDSRESELCKNSTIIIHKFLSFCDPTEEFFQTIRLVSKSWKFGIETMKYDEFNSEFWKYKIHAYEGKFPIFLKKYLQMFTSFKVHFSPEDYDNFFEHWETLKPLLLENLKNLKEIKMLENEIHHFYPENFFDFWVSLVKNSKNSLKSFSASYGCLEYFEKEDLFPKGFTLPKLEQYYLSTAHMRPEADPFWDLYFIRPSPDEINERVRKQMKEIVEKAVQLFPELRTISLDSQDIFTRFNENGLNDPVIEVLIKNFNKHLYTANPIDYTQTKYLVPPKLAEFRSFPDDVDYLSNLQIAILQVENPTSEKWKNLDNFIESCPELQTIIFSKFTKKELLDEKISNLSKESKKIWRQRFLFLKSFGLKIYFKNEEHLFEEEFKQIWKNLDISWDFTFET